MFTLGGFSESQDPNSIFVPQAAMVDGHLRTEGDSLIVPNMNHIIGVYALSTGTAIRHRLVSPTLRRINNLEVSPIVNAIAPALANEIMLTPENPIPLTINEELTSEDNAATAGGQQFCGVWLADGPISPVSGEIHHVHFTVSLTTILNTWVLGNITLTDDLPVRDFDIVGGALVGANIIAFRIVVPGYAWRPGAVCQPTVQAPNHPLFRNGGLGVWCRFNPVSLPSIEIASSTAAATGTLNGVLDVIPR